MLIVMVRIPINSPEQVDQMIERFKNRAGRVDSYPGFLGFELLRGDEECVSMTRWASREDLDRWMNSPDNIQAHAKTPEYSQASGHGQGTAAHGSHGHGQAAGPPRPQVSIYEVAIPGAEKP